MNSEERILVGIINPNTYITKSNNKDCTYIDIGFEKFRETTDRSTAESYEIVNRVKFLDDSPKVFLTSNANSMIRKFGEGRLVQMIANPSPENKGDKGCKYTVLYEKISEVNAYDFIEIVEPVVSSWNASERKAFFRCRPSTVYVMVKCVRYTVSRDDFPFVEKTMEFFTPEEARKYVADCYNDAYGEPSPDSLEFSFGRIAFAFRSLNGRFFDLVRERTLRSLDPGTEIADVSEESLRGAVAAAVAELAGNRDFVGETARTVSRALRGEECLRKMAGAAPVKAPAAPEPGVPVREAEAPAGESVPEPPAAPEPAGDLPGEAGAAAAPAGAPAGETAGSAGAPPEEPDGNVPGAGETGEAPAAVPAAALPDGLTKTVPDGFDLTFADGTEVTVTPSGDGAFGVVTLNERGFARKHEIVLDETLTGELKELHRQRNGGAGALRGELAERVLSKIAAKVIEKKARKSAGSGGIFEKSLGGVMDDLMFGGAKDGAPLGSVPKKPLGDAVSKAVRSPLFDTGGIGAPEEEEEEEEIPAAAPRNPAASPGEAVFARIGKKEVLMGPFVVPETKFKKIESSGDGYSYEGVLCLPDDRCAMAVKDDPQGLSRVIDRDLVGEYLYEVVINGVARSYLVKMPVQTWNSSGRKIDLLDDQKLLNDYAPRLLSAQFKGLSKNQLTLITQNVQGLALIKKDHDRVRRFMKLLGRVVDFDDQRKKLFNLLQDQPVYRSFLREYVDSNSAEMIKDYRRDLLADVNEEKDKAQVELDVIKAEIGRQRETLAALKRKTRGAAGREEGEAAGEAADGAAREAGARSPRTVPAAEHEVLKSEHRRLQAECERLRREADDLRGTREALGRELSGSLSELSSRYLEMHTMLKAFTAPRRIAGGGFSFGGREPDAVPTDNVAKARKRFIEELMKTMRGYGRYLSVEKLISMVVTIAQNQFTVLAGCPGSGKTSFVKTLGKALNLGDRSHTIPVARGWTSQRDVLGYWNSLTASFQPAPTGLWELLTTLDGEKDPAAVTPAFVLLDEMNLSSPEHYFSSFMQLADGESERKIFTGSPEKPYLRIPDYLRFIGTVNSDDTVNVMSARMLDRAPVILFDERPGEGGERRGARSAAPDPMPAYSARDWQILFNPGDARIRETTRAVLDEIEDQLYREDERFGQRVVVSYRKRQQIVNFLSLFEPLLGSLKNCDSETIALDFAVRQFILPLANGFGEGFGARLEALADILDKRGLNGAQAILRRLISEGAERMNSYQFLA